MIRQSGKLKTRTINKFFFVIPFFQTKLVCILSGLQVMLTVNAENVCWYTFRWTRRLNVNIVFLITKKFRFVNGIRTINKHFLKPKICDVNYFMLVVQLASSHRCLSFLNRLLTNKSQIDTYDVTHSFESYNINQTEYTSLYFTTLFVVIIFFFFCIWSMNIPL